MREADKSKQDDHSDDVESRVDAYSHYRTVSDKVHDDINEAVDAFSFLNSRWSQGIGLTPQSASSAKRAILRASKRLLYEIRMSRGASPELAKIHDRWVDGDGWVRLLEDADLRTERPEFLSQMVDDLVRAGWELGYLKSGRIEREPQTEESETEKQVSEMFE